MSLLLALALVLPVQAARLSWPDLRSPPAESAGDGSKDAAVIIAIEDYLHLSDIAGAGRNAEAWSSWLLRTRGVPLARVEVLRDRDASDHKMRAAVQRAANEVQPGGTLWVVFIGHGVGSEDGNDAVLIGVDADASPEGLWQRGVRRGELVQTMSSGAHERAVFVVDACFSGQGQDGRALVKDLQGLMPTWARIDSKRVSVLTATGPGEFAGRLPGTKQPAFSYLVLGAMRGWGDTDGDGVVSAQEAVNYARGALRATVKS